MVVETRSGVISHYEMLARFSGEDSPVGLICAAEKSGQICHLEVGPGERGEAQRGVS